MDVLISGASMAGLSAAYWFARLGHRVTLVERADGLRPGDERPRVADQRLSRVGQPRRLAGSIEQGDAERRLERLNRLADRRLDPAELSRSGRKAPSVGDGDENAHLVERERVDHPSPPEMDSSTILPIATIGTTVDI